MYFKYLSNIFGRLLCYGILMGATLIVLNACNKKKDPKGIVINEIMAANHTGLMAEDGNVYDWIEIKNISSKTISLEDYSLIVDKSETKSKNKGKKSKDKDKESADKDKEPKDKDKDSKDKDSKNKDKDKQQKDQDEQSKLKCWNFPEMELKPGECTIIFASKLDTQDPEHGLHANFKLPSEGAKVQLAYDEDVVSEVKYGQMEDDETYRRLDNGKFEKSYEPSPGHDNNDAGYEAYCKFIDGQRKGPLRIWEVKAKGEKEGNAWIEVKNVSDKDVDLKDYCLATKTKAMSEWQFPSVVLKPGQFHVVDCRKDKFKVGDTRSVMLTKEGKFVDGLCPVKAPYDVSVGRAEGELGPFYFPSPTKGEENTSKHYRFIAKQPSFDPTPGVYADKKSMKILINTHGRNVRYTTNGSMPTKDSPLYKDSITIQKTTTIRAFCESDSSYMQSEAITATFIFGEEHDLPVINITVNKADLYNNYSGIYVRGPRASAEHPHYGANYWKKVWKKAHIEFYDGKEGFSEDCQLAIFGGFSRVLAKKSFKIKFAGTKGPSSLTYDLFGNGKPMKYKNFVLRSGSQDISGVMVRDEYFTSLMRPESPTLLIQPYRPVALYINGEYFGLYYIREKIDKRFVARHLNVSNDSVSIVMSGMYCEEGSAADYNQIMSYVKSHDMAEKEHYEWVKNKFDLIGLIDYKLGEIYSGNTDVGNVRYVRSTDAKSDKKWHVVFYDLDATWASNKPASFYLRTNGSGPEQNVSTHNILIDLLLKNKEFRELFLERLSLHMHKTFSTKNATEVFDNLINTIKPEMEHNCKRWPAVLSYSSWEKHVDAFREKFKDRNKIVLNSIREELNITAEEEKKYFSDLGY